jgi:lipoprotein-anchoring transpeptidase ErfK/SrfK
MDKETRTLTTALVLILFGASSACVTSQTELAGATGAPTPAQTPGAGATPGPSGTPTSEAEASNQTVTPTVTPTPDIFAPNTVPSPTATPTPDSAASVSAPSVPLRNAIPADTRIVINAPAYRMDVFENGRLVKSYRIGIGYPEFPLPAGTREASSIIFNPTWTPPNEPWVESPGGKIKIGEKIEAGSALNPLGLVKIPIGAPSLIHGGKSPARLGGFASHGCVGLTNAQVIDLAKRLAPLGGVEITDDQIANYRQKRSTTKNINLPLPIPVELRYETIVVEDGKLRIYRDVYERGTNTEENLRNTLAAYGVAFESLSESDRALALQALDQMSRNANGTKIPPATLPLSVDEMTNPAPSAAPIKSGPPKSGKKKSGSGRTTRQIKGEKEKVIEIPALAGKGYAAPVELDTGKVEARPAASKHQAPTQKRNRR